MYVKTLEGQSSSDEHEFQTNKGQNQTLYTAITFVEDSYHDSSPLFCWLGMGLLKAILLGGDSNSKSSNLEGNKIV